MGSLRLVGLALAVMALAALFWGLGTGALETGDQLPSAAIAGQTGGSHSSPSVASTGPDNNAQATPKRLSNTPPLLLVSPAAVIPENVVIISGQGFSPGERVTVAVNAPGVAGGVATSDKDGNFYGLPITVTTATPMGTYEVRAEGQQGVAQAMAKLTVEGGTPFVAPSTYSAKGGAEVGFQGGGFRSNEIVSIHFDSLAVNPLEQIVAGTEGSVAVTATVPLADPGEHSFILIGEESRYPLRIPFSVVGFSPWISPTNYSPAAEQRIGFVGHDFAPGEVVHIYRSKLGGDPIAVVHADKDGEFELVDAYDLPIDALGKTLFLAMGQHSRVVVSTSLEVLPFSPGLELSVYAGQPGTTVTFKGAGYARGETITAFLGGTAGGREIARFPARNDGSFEDAGAFLISPDIAAGNVTISAVGERSRVPIEISFAVLPLTPWAALTRYSGSPGTSLTFEGHGFLPTENVTIHLGDQQSPVLGTAQADSQGSFAGGGTYTVPDSADGKVTFTMLGEKSRAVAAATFTVTQGEDSSFDATPAVGDNPPQ